MFVCCISGLICGIICICLNVAILFWGGNSVALKLAVLPFWFIMIQSATWAYCMRIKVLGGYLSKEEKSLKFIPWIIMAFELTIWIYTICIIMIRGLSSDAYLVIRIIFSVIITCIEVFLYFLLIRKVTDLLEFRKKMKTILAYELTGSLILLVLLDLILIVSLMMNTKMDYILRPFTYLLRIVVLIRFFGDLLDELTCNSLSRISNRPDSLLPNFDGMFVPPAGNFIEIDK